MANAASYKALAGKKVELIRKTLDVSVFVAPMTSTVIDAISEYTAAVVGPPAVPEKIELLELPAGYEDLGHMTTDGAQFARETAVSNINSVGAGSPTRSDVVTDTSTLTVVCQETKLITLGLATGAELAGIVAHEDSGEVVIKMPERPKSRAYRLLGLAVDDGDYGEIWIGRHLPRAKVTGYANQTLASGDNALEWGVTFTGEMDTAYGSPGAYFFAGPGWLALLEDMGIPLAA